MEHRRIVSGIQPSGRLHLGNYLGSISNLAKLQREGETFLFVADLHAITVDFDPGTVSRSKTDIVATCLASGVDPNRVTIFVQSDVPEHAALGYVLMCHTNLGELERMTQYKAKAADPSLRQENNTTRIPTGLLVYPALMAADILLYQANFVPVGADQKQHIELTRDVASRFNARYGQTFAVPEPLINHGAGRIMDLADPSKKMSKSSKSGKGVIFLDDPIDAIQQKIKSAKTDSANCVRHDPAAQPGIANLMNIYAAVANDPANAALRDGLFAKNKTVGLKDLELKYRGQDYRNFKADLTSLTVNLVKTIQAKKSRYGAADLAALLRNGASAARKIAGQTLRSVYEKIGFTAKQ